jgi:hypothetical protein
MLFIIIIDISRSDRIPFENGSGFTQRAFHDQCHNGRRKSMRYFSKNNSLWNTGPPLCDPSHVILFHIYFYTFRFIFLLLKGNSPFMKKIPPGAEVNNVLVGEVDFLDKPVSAFVRLAKGTILGDFAEVRLPSRFVFLLLGPKVFIIL